MNIRRTLLSSMVAVQFIVPNLAWSRPPKDLLPKEQAETAALKVYSGAVEKVKLKKKYRIWLYDFHIRGKGDLNVFHEVFINAKTGEMVFHLIEKDKKSEKKKAVS